MPDEYHNRYALLLRPGVLEFREEELSSFPLRPDFVRLHVAHCAICGSDISFYKGRPKADYPRTLGHEYYGSVVMTADESDMFKVGETVVVDPNYRCGQCSYCRSGVSNLCISSAVNLFTRRGFSDYVDIHHSYLHKLPDLSPDFLGTLVEPLSCALHAIELSKVQETDRILILGCGGQGSLISIVLSTMHPDIKIDLYDPVKQKARKLASAFSSAVNPLSNPLVQTDYSLVFEVSGQSVGFDFATLAVGKGGRMIISSRYHDRKVYLPAELPHKECTIVFSHLNGNGESIQQAIEFITDQWNDKFNQLFKVESLSDIGRVFEDIEKSVYCKTIIRVNEEL